MPSSQFRAGHADTSAHRANVDAGDRVASNARDGAAAARGGRSFGGRQTHTRAGSDQAQIQGRTRQRR